VCTVPLPAYSYEKIVLGIPEFKPYTQTANNVISGSAISPVKQAFTALNTPVVIKPFATYTDLLKAVKKNTIQGFFLATQNKERDLYATFSKPITINNWAWFTVKEGEYQLGTDEFKRNGLIGTIEKTNTFRWLTRNGYQVHADLATNLPLLLKDKKLDAVFAAQTVFEKSSRDANISPRIFKRKVEVGKAFGIYISKSYLQRNQGFMQDLNHYIENHIFKARK
jgi:hypothetical protein